MYRTANRCCVSSIGRRGVAGQDRFHFARLISVTILVSACAALVAGQGKSISNDLPKTPYNPRAQILVLGTFHFKNAGTDDYKPKYSVDVQSAARQREIASLLDTLAAFRPTKIAVEWLADEQAELDKSYGNYLAGKQELTANEIHQLGFRLAERLGHKRLFAVDAKARWYDNNFSTELMMQHARQNKQEQLMQRGQKWDAYFNNLSEFDDKMKTEMSITDFLVYLNKLETLKVTLSQYLVGSVEVGGNGDYYGADMRTAWYNRNIRIFTNIQRLASEPGERVLVIIGQGHVPILRHLVENSLEFELVEFSKMLAAPSARPKV